MGDNFFMCVMGWDEMKCLIGAKLRWWERGDLDVVWQRSAARIPFRGARRGRSSGGGLKKKERKKE